MVIGEVCVILGYYGADLIYYGTAPALVNLYWNLAQAGAGIAIGMVFFFTTYRVLPKLQWSRTSP